MNFVNLLCYLGVFVEIQTRYRIRTPSWCFTRLKKKEWLVKKQYGATFISFRMSRWWNVKSASNEWQRTWIVNFYFFCLLSVWSWCAWLFLIWILNVWNVSYNCDFFNKFISVIVSVQPATIVSCKLGRWFSSKCIFSIFVNFLHFLPMNRFGNSLRNIISNYPDPNYG